MERGMWCVCGCGVLSWMLRDEHTHKLVQDAACLHSDLQETVLYLKITQRL